MRLLLGKKLDLMIKDRYSHIKPFNFQFKKIIFEKILSYF